ncbi:Dephospho-CoA kinase [Pontiella sulfatireligans]|uniref:Dephospho-CoA kinase n=2 Tax=Pontiella sulfatireligans TaxID=2750658 RepID=A0A6C2UH78_9BACT|nr:Dephospho-CoA kinase [Pontiella sulfatireligans]
MILGVTGGIACGKSEVGRILGEMGFSVCDADVVAHNLMAKGALAFQKVVDHFGSGILSEEGEILRPALGHIVFEHPEQREILNGLVHPAVRHALAEWIEQMQAEGRRSAVLLPLLFESGMQDLGWNSILCVSSREADVVQRLEQRGLSREESEKRVHSQMPLAEKERLADHVVPNDGTLEELELAVQKTVQAISR